MTDQVHTVLPVPGTRMTTEEFLDLPETMTAIELMDGFVIYPFGYPDESQSMSPSPTVSHQKSVRNIFRVVDTVEHGEAWFAPMDVVFPDGSVVQPDIFWISDNNPWIDTDNRIHGVPDLIVEVLSPSTEQYDKQKKFRLYEKAGVAEYWIASPGEKSMEVWRLLNGKYHKRGVYQDSAQFVSPLLGIEVNLADIFS